MNATTARKMRRLRLLLIAAVALGSSSATLSGTLASLDGHQARSAPAAPR